MRRATKTGLIGVFLAATLLIAAVFGVGEILSQSASRTVGPPPIELGLETVLLQTKSRLALAGWFAAGKIGGGAVLLLHGVRGDRRDMLSRARALRNDGYSVLLIDLPSHGESQGDRISFGLREAEGATAAMDFLRTRLPSERVGVIGVSLGAAALVFSDPGPAPAAIVLESMYPTIREAVENRLAIRLGEMGRLFAPILLWQLPLRLGITEDELCPITRLPHLKAPVLVVAGDLDRHTTLAETLRLYDVARGPKELWVVRGAAHVNLHRFAPEAYEARVFAFLARYLRNRTPPSTSLH